MINNSSPSCLTQWLKFRLPVFSIRGAGRKSAINLYIAPQSLDARLPLLVAKWQFLLPFISMPFF